MRLSTDFSHDSTTCDRRRDAAGDTDRGSSFPPIRHITYHTRTTDCGIGKNQPTKPMKNNSFTSIIHRLFAVSAALILLMAQSTGCSKEDPEEPRHPRYLGCRAARSDLHIDRQRSLHLRQRIRIRRRRGTAPRPHRFGGIYRSGRARHLDGDRFRRSRRSDQRRIQSLCVAQRPEPAARTHDLQSAFGHSGQSGHEYQRHRHLQRRTGGRSGRIGRFGGDKNGCRRDLLPRIGQKERICLHLGAERLRSGSFGYDATLLRLPKPVGFDGRATGFRTCEMRQQSSSRSRLHGRAPGPARFGP